MVKAKKNEIWKRNEIESPCKKICIIHPISKLCIGCYRSAEEIRLWSNYSKKKRTKLLKELPHRENDATPKIRRGRDSHLKKRDKII